MTSTIATTAVVLAGFGAVLAPPAAAAPVGQGFPVTASDISFILKQIRIAEAHVRNTTAATGPCGALLATPGDGIPDADQVPTVLTSYGLRTVDGSCNNLHPGKETWGAADVAFPRLATATFRDADDLATAGIGNGPTSYANPTGTVVDAEPRLVSNLIVDQTSTNPAAVEAARNPVRTQGNEGVFACGVPGAPPAPNCIPPGETLSIPNVTTDVGLSPPFNGLFTIFGQFFDHGVDFTSKTSDAVVIPLRTDDPLLARAGQTPFMVLSRTSVNADRDGVNRDTPFVDQSQTYTSHASHQAFLREYEVTGAGPVATGKLLASPGTGTASALPRWADVKAQARDVLGLALIDLDVHNIPMIASDAYGNFVPGPLRGLPMVVTDPDGTGPGAAVLVEGDTAAPVVVSTLPGLKRVDTAFLDDIAHHAAPKPGLVPDTDAGTSDDGDRTTYDDEMLDAHFIAGDGRANENIALTAVHQVFHSEHDRLVDEIQDILAAPGNETLRTAFEGTVSSGPNKTFRLGERYFQAARFITEMEYQHLVFEEFGRKVQPLIDPFTVYHDDVNPAVQAEFAHAVYRFGHSMLTDSIDRVNTDGSRNDIPLLEGFLNPPAYYDGGSAGTLNAGEAAGSVLMGMSDQVGEEIDEFVTETLRNNLLGLPLDLPTLNIARARDAGVPPLNEFRRQVFADTNDSQLKPYTDWVDFGLQLKHPESLVNFVAAYGTHPSITGAGTLTAKREAARAIVDPLPADVAPADAADFMFGTGDWQGDETGLGRVDLWVGGLAERTNLFGGLLGSTFNYVFERQMVELQNGDRFYYLARTPGMNLRGALEGNSFAELVMRNTTAKSLKADAFGTADCKFEIANLTSPAPSGADVTGAGSVADDPASECDENALLIRKADGTFQYRTTNSVDPAGINGQSVFNGTAAGNRVWGGVDNDTFLGNEADDVLEGDDGADVAIGGEGNDIITDRAGDDVPKGGPGNDAIEAGPGLDILMGGTGHDYLNGGTNDNETFAGEGDDLVVAGQGIDAVFGDGGSDWIQGGDGQDLLQGDSGAPFFDDPNKPGHDILIGQNGEEDYDAEGGDDIMVAGPGIERNSGAGGFDWITHQNDPVAADTDLNRRLIADGGLPVDVQRDRVQEVEAASGWRFDDRLVGDDVVPATVGGLGLTGCDALDQAGLDRIAGLDALVPALDVPLADLEGLAAVGTCPLTGPNVWGAGNVLLGGEGSDLLEGRGADDVLDGDQWLAVRLSVRTDRDDPATEIGTTELLERPYRQGSTQTLQADIMAGVVDPGNVVAVRELRTAPAGSDVDTAVFSGAAAEYLVSTDPQDPTVTIVDHQGGADGVDRLTRVECLQFTDVRQPVSAGSCPNLPATGGVTIGDLTPTEDQQLTVASTIADPDGLPTGITFTWQSETAPGTWADVANGATFTPGDGEVDRALRVQATFVDGQGVQESVFSDPTGPVANVNDAPTGRPAMTTTRFQQGATVTADAGTLADADGLPGTFTFQWQTSTDGTAWTDVAGATGSTLTLGAGQVGRQLRVVVGFVDGHGTTEAVASPSSGVVVEPFTVPTAPAITSVTAGDRAATVNFTAPSDNGGTPLTGFVVQAVDAGNVVRATVTADAAARSVLVPGLTAGTAYRIRVAATNAVGTGPGSALSAAVTPGASPGTPLTPTVARANGSVTVTWAAPVAGSSATTGYVVRVVDPAGAVVGTPRSVPATPLNAVFTTGLTPGTAYRFQVAAVNAVGTGAYSPLSASIVYATAPAAPTIGTAVRGSASATVTWTPGADGGAPVTGYQVDVLTTAGAVVRTNVAAPATATSLVVTALTNGTAYQFRVRAVNPLGTSPSSALSAAVTPASVPTVAPGSLTLTQAPGQLTAAWAAVTTGTGGLPVTGYTVRVVDPAGAQVGALRQVTGTNVVITGLVIGTTYRFQVAAVNAVGQGPYSALSVGRAFANAPSAPATPTAAGGTSTFLINPITARATWVAPANGGSAITGYRVYAQRYTAADGLTPVGAAAGSPLQGAGVRTYEFSGLVNGGFYRLQVEAVNGAGTSPRSAFSAVVVAR